MLMAAVAGECSRFQLIPPNFFFPPPFLPELHLCKESGPAFVMFNLVQAPGRLKLALGFGHDTFVPVVFALWPRLPAWPLPNKNRSEGACSPLSEVRRGRRQGRKKTARREAAPGGWTRRAFGSHWPCNLGQACSLQKHPTCLDPCLAWPWSSSVTRPCSVSSTPPLSGLRPAATNLGSFHSSWNWTGAWDLSSGKLYFSLGWRRTLKLRSRPPSW